jgi:hypothetical protein
MESLGRKKNKNAKTLVVLKALNTDQKLNWRKRLRKDSCVCSSAQNNPSRRHKDVAKLHCPVIFNIQGDYKSCERLHKFIGQKIISTQTSKAHHCKEQPKTFFSYPMQVQYVLHLLPCTYRDDIRLRATHYATKADQFLQSLGGSFSKFLLKSRWTVITDFVEWNSSTQNTFSGWVTILSLCCTLVARVEITSYACVQ